MNTITIQNPKELPADKVKAYAGTPEQAVELHDKRHGGHGNVYVYTNSNNQTTVFVEKCVSVTHN